MHGGTERDASYFKTLRQQSRRKREQAFRASAQHISPTIPILLHTYRIVTSFNPQNLSYIFHLPNHVVVTYYTTRGRAHVRHAGKQWSLYPCSPEELLQRLKDGDLSERPTSL